MSWPSKTDSKQAAVIFAKKILNLWTWAQVQARKEVLTTQVPAPWLKYLSRKVQRYLLTWLLEENAHTETQMHWYSQAGTMYPPITMYQGSQCNLPGRFIGSQVPSNPLPAACLPSSESAPQVLTSNHCAPLCYITSSNDAIIIKATIWDEKTVQCQETYKWMLPFCHQFLPRANNIFHWKLWGFCHPHPSQTYRICRSRFFFSESNTFVNIRATMIVMMFVWIWWQGRSPGFYICLQRFYWTENTTLYHPFTTANPTPLAFIASFF